MNKIIDKDIVGKKAFIFGAGNYGKRFYRLYHDKKFKAYFPEFDIAGFIDNDEKKQGHYECGVFVYSLEEVKNIISGQYEKYMIILSSTVLAGEMVEQLFSNSLEEVNCYLLPEWVVEFRITKELESNVLVPVDVTKPILSRIEYKVTHDCNLNCKGCNSLCGLREKEYADLGEFISSLERLKDIFSNISVIKLLGGEPLLHPELDKFIEAIRNCFPAADISILTNGLLIPSQGDNVFDACRKYGCRFEVSQYPATMVINDKIIARLEKEDVTYSMRGDTLVFRKRINPMGTCDRKANEQNCPQWYALYDGKLSRCFLWDSLQYLMKKFPEFKVDEQKLHDYIDLYHTQLSGREIIQKLKEPMEHCVYCGMVDDNPELYEWGRASEKDLCTIDPWLMSGK